MKRLKITLCILISSIACVGVAKEHKLMTYNIHHAEGTDKVYDISRIAQVIQESGAEVVGLQEVDRAYSMRSYLDDQPEIVAAILGMNSYYGPNIEDRYGNMLLASAEIIEPRNVELPNPAEKEPRGVIVARVKLEETVISVLVTHLSAFEPENRPPQIEKIKETANALEGKIIIMGDFNCLPSGELGALLEDGRFFSSREILGLEEAIDDIIVSSNLSESIFSGEIIESSASDHPAYCIIVDVEGAAAMRSWGLYE